MKTTAHKTRVEGDKNKNVERERKTAEWGKGFITTGCGGDDSLKQNFVDSDNARFNSDRESPTSLLVTLAAAMSEAAPLSAAMR